MLLKDICTPEVVTCSPTTSVLAAARLMRERHVGDLIVMESSGEASPLGIVTDRDIVIEVLGRELDPATVRVRDVMRAPVVIAHGGEDAAVAVERMCTHGVRRVPVMGADRRLIGIVSLDDLVRQLAANAQALADVVTHQQTREQRARR